MKAAIYARVSTKEKGQTNDNQLLELRAFAQRLGYTVYKEYTDQESGGSAKRPAIQELLLDCHQRHFDVVLFWSLDRLSREGVGATLGYLQRFSDAGVQFKSYTEQYLDSTGPFREAVIAILAAIAKQERTRLSERVVAGMVRAEKKGAKFGRPRIENDLASQVWSLRQNGLSYRQIAEHLQMPVGTVHRYGSAATAAGPPRRINRKKLPEA